MLILGVAAIGAVFGRQPVRAFWGGFAGFGYLALCVGPWASEAIRPHLATNKAAGVRRPRLDSTPPSTGTWIATPGFSTSMSAGDLFVAGQPQRVEFVTSYSTQPQTARLFATTTASESFLRVGHSLFALVLALLGGIVARHRHSLPQA